MKSEPKFTPGDWKTYECWNGILEIHSDDEVINGEEIGEVIAQYISSEANAYLLKASPKLYHALEDLLDAFDRLQMGFPPPYEENKIRKEMAEVALAEARGE